MIRTKSVQAAADSFCNMCSRLASSLLKRCLGACYEVCTTMGLDMIMIQAGIFLARCALTTHKQQPCMLKGSSVLMRVNDDV